MRVGYRPCPDAGKADIRRVPALSEIDFDPVFLARFDVDALIDDKVELLNHQERVDWNTSWHADLSTPLWRFNLHYFEYLLPLGKAYLDSGDSRYLDKAKAVISSWIQACPQFKGGPAWDSYTISMRAVNWLAFYSELQGHLDEDAAFMELLIVHSQSNSRTLLAISRWTFWRTTTLRILKQLLYFHAILMIKRHWA